MGAIALWVNARSDLKALGLTGSWSRGSARANSDLDLLILADAPEQYRSDQRWLYHIALPEPFRIMSYWGTRYGAAWSCHAMLEPAAKLELTFAAIGWASTDPIDAGTRRVVSDGFHVIVDKGGRLHRVVEAVKISN
jgi:hypothetical protein